MRAHELLTGLLCAAATAGAAWLDLRRDGMPRDTPRLLAALGLPPRDPGARCMTSGRAVVRGRVDMERCVRFRRLPGTRSGERREVEREIRSRRVVRAQRSWESPDSRAWRRSLDSTRAALARQGGVRSACLPLMPTPIEEQVRERWDFPGFAVYVFANHLHRAADWPRRSPGVDAWLTHLTARTDTRAGCRPATRRAPPPAAR